MRSFLTASLVLAIFLSASFALAQNDLGGLGDFGGFGGFGGDEVNPVAVAAQFTAATADRPAVLMVTATIDPEWHIYSITQPKGGPLRTLIRLTPSDDYRLIGEFRPHPEAHSHVDTVVWKGLTIEEHDGKVTWYVPIEIREGVSAESLTISGEVRAQACKESCLPPSPLAFQAKLGEGVAIGAVEISKVAPVDDTAAAPDRVTEQIDPPKNAGIHRAEGSVITWYGWIDSKNVQPGGRTYLRLRAEMPDDWHLPAYAKTDPTKGNKPTLLAVRSTDGITSYLPTTDSQLIEKESPVEGFGKLRYHEGNVTWTIPIDVATALKPGEYRIDGLIGYQACEASGAEQGGGLGSCELEKGLTFAVTLQVGDAGTISPASVTFTTADYASAVTLAKEVAPSIPSPVAVFGALRIIEFAASESNFGLVGMLGAALLGGLILNLMPCVLPVIGLKVLSFAKQGGESRARVFTLNLAYVAGLLTVFLLLATLASLAQLGLATDAGDNFNWGELNTQLWFKVGMAALVFVMALSFLDVWEIPLPGFAGGSTASELSSREGYGGAFFKGVLTTILATPCSGPFLGPVFGYTIGQSAQITFLIFLFVGLGMALPYLVIGAFPSLVRWIPKPGAWMDTFKQLMAFMLLGTVVYLFSTIHADFFVPTLALLVALWFACWLGGRQSITVPLARRSLAWAFGLAVAAIVGIVGFGPKNESELAWLDYTPAALAEKQASGKTVMLEFTASWCPTCKTNLMFALDVPDVEAVVLANEVVPMKADWSDEDEAIENALLQLRSRSIPLLAIFPANRPGEVIVLRDTVTKSQVLKALAQAGAGEENPHRTTARVSASTASEKR